jgi:CHAD domain-containing protein
MLKRKYLLDHFEFMWESMMAHFYAFSETQDIEELHQLRIEIKKIFALTALLEFSTRSFDFSDCLKPLKTIFIKAGEIRNIQITLLTIMRYTGKNSSLYEVQQAMLTNFIKMFCLKTALYVKNLKQAHKSILIKICDIENGCISSWYEEKLQTLQMFFAKKSVQENMHDGRKTLKKLLYVYAILHKPLQDKLRLNKYYLHKLQESIGKWHDVTVSMEILSRSNFTDNETVEKLLERKQKLLKLCWELSKNFAERSVAC